MQRDPLRCAQEWDVDKAGRDHWNAGCPPTDPRVEAYSTRLHCYELVLGSLQTFDELVTAARGVSGHEVIVDDSQLVSQTAYRTALGSRDAVFHSTLYNWWIERGSAEEPIFERQNHLVCRYWKHLSLKVIYSDRL